MRRASRLACRRSRDRSAATARRSFRHSDGVVGDVRGGGGAGRRNGPAPSRGAWARFSRTAPPVVSLRAAPRPIPASAAHSRDGDRPVSSARAACRRVLPRTPLCQNSALSTRGGPLTSYGCGRPAATRGLLCESHDRRPARGTPLLLSFAALILSLRSPLPPRTPHRTTCISQLPSTDRFLQRLMTNPSDHSRKPAMYPGMRSASSSACPRPPPQKG
jgi:hypothetical protein